MLILSLHASALSPRLYLLQDGKVALDDLDTSDVADPARGATWTEMTQARLAAIGATVGDIDRLLLDIGPGRLSAVRAAVSFGNALGFGLDRPVTPVIASAALGLQAHSATGLSVLTVHKSAGGNAYVGRVDGGQLIRLHHGPLAETLAAAAAGLSQAAVVGLAAADAACLPPSLAATDAGDGAIRAETFLQISLATPATPYAPVQPITDQSEILRD